jgi:hypothetical protein
MQILITIGVDVQGTCHVQLEVGHEGSLICAIKVCRRTATAQATPD